MKYSVKYRIPDERYFCHKYSLKYYVNIVVSLLISFRFHFMIYIHVFVHNLPKTALKNTQGLCKTQIKKGFQRQCSRITAINYKSDEYSMARKCTPALEPFIPKKCNQIIGLRVNRISSFFSIYVDLIAEIP